jgi:DNA-binding response OmpR family regulator
MEEAAGGGAPATKVVSRRVLVVEDNLDAVHSLVTLLRQDGHQVDFAINGYAALEVAKRFRPEVVLLDLGLPGLDGFDVCSRLKSEPGHEGMRIIAVTAYAQDEHRVRARAAGCDLHIVKPYDPRKLLAVVREI